MLKNMVEQGAAVFGLGHPGHEIAGHDVVLQHRARQLRKNRVTRLRRIYSERFGHFANIGCELNGSWPALGHLIDRRRHIACKREIIPRVRRQRHSSAFPGDPRPVSDPTERGSDLGCGSEAPPIRGAAAFGCSGRRRLRPHLATGRWAWQEKLETSLKILWRSSGARCHRRARRP
jgi:hypothetical protein